MIWFARFAFIGTYALFWGGHTFYTGFVVRIAHDILNDPIDGGLITQRVTSLLQLLCCATVLMMFINAMLIARRNRKFGISLGLLAGIVAVAVGALFVVHGRLDAVIDIANGEIVDRDAFTIGHRRYNQWTTVQWVAALLYLPVTLAAWRSIDRGAANGEHSKA